MLCRNLTAGRPLVKSPSARPFAVVATRCKPIMRATDEEKEEKKQHKEEKKKEKKEKDYNGPDIVPDMSALSGFLAALVDETDIVDVHLEVGNFELKVKRSVQGEAAAASAAAHAPAAAAAPVAALPKAEAPVMTTHETPIAEESVDESLLPVTSPKVGIFRRGRYAGNKRVGKGNCVSEKDSLKKGQAVGFVEQLGTFVPVEAPQAGEVIKFDVKDGEAVEYLQTIVHIAPFFGGPTAYPTAV